MDQLVRILKKSPIFLELPEDVLKNEILPLGRQREVAKGNHLIYLQETCDTFGVILSGKVNLIHVYENGNCAIMGILEKSDLLGADLACTRSRISPYYAVAVQETKVLSFPISMVLLPGTLRDEIRLNILHRLLTFVADENIRKEYRLAILFQKGLRDRIMTFLTMQASKRKTNTFTVPFTRDEMASYLCVNRSCLSHELSLMEQEGILTFKRNTFTLLANDK